MDNPTDFICYLVRGCWENFCDSSAKREYLDNGEVNSRLRGLASERRELDGRFEAESMRIAELLKTHFSEILTQVRQPILSDMHEKDRKIANEIYGSNRDYWDKVFG
ncbi:hypothetical protein HY450_00635 [Candidatus Pacearchaeota archaeon]|nr:hypothetical protein [Candidatus Pacearchaeota archaeon]